LNQEAVLHRADVVQPEEGDIKGFWAAKAAQLVILQEKNLRPAPPEEQTIVNDQGAVLGHEMSRNRVTTRISKIWPKLRPMLRPG
jgi:hypothetical protein